MPRPKNAFPSYQKQTNGRARAIWTDPAGVRHFRAMPGLFDSPESRTAFARLQLELAESPTAHAANSDGIRVVGVLLAYVDHAERHYLTATGEPTGEIKQVKTVVRIVRELYGNTPAAAFGPLALKAVRRQFIAKGWCRRSVNQQTERVRRIFKWAASEELVPTTIHTGLATLSGLQRGRTPARETEPVGPVDDAIVDATTEHLNRHVAGLIRFQRLTGCRPGEACSIRRCDIDTGGTTWVYRPAHHKNSHRGKSRTIYIGPAAQTLIREFFTTDFNDYLFSPARATSEVRENRAANRKTPRYPSHVKRNMAKRKANPKRTPAARYNRVSYHVAISRACDKAFPPPEPLAQRVGETAAARKARLTPEQWGEVKAWQRDHRWHPNQLRHTFATKVRKEHGLEAAQVLLGHARADVTQVYAERDTATAVGIVAKIG